ncbi:Dynein light chain 1, cytoplasmic [Hondaea fermentalgiana]|uniref:Dynein light chain 1, cytoplasmic n=1 Tax=Hondaea fermentalgiana TaxID=2315210 RepID=A0A2R5GDF1_9STRA|nr:Dynein light chain 1, cytoplasmic [Hondaea fermentalgiana]|eukprot:GBG28967.1 Dynein light chain 1, cytoplasmic [Hondaea fermentalgiana]
MQNYIFFGSAGQILDFTKSLLAEQAQVSRMGRVRYLIFDWTHVYGIDYSGLGVFLDIANVLKKHEVMFVFTGVKENIIRSMLREGILQHGAAVFDHLDLGVEWIEEQLLEWAHLVRSRWLEFRPVVKLHDLARNKAKHDALEEILKDTGFGNELWRFVKRVVIAKGETLCEPGKPAESLYIVQQGKFSSVFADANGNVRKIRSYARGAYINEMAVFTTALQQHKIIADTENCAVIVMTQYEISRLRASRPNIFMALQQTILRHYWQSNLKLEREISDFEQFAPLPGDLRQQNSSDAEATASVKFRSGKLAKRASMLSRGSSFEAGLAFLHAVINLIQKDSERWLIQDELLGAGLTNKVSTGTTLNVLFEGFSSEIELLHGRAGIVRLQAYTDEVHNVEAVERPARICEDEEDLCAECTSLGPEKSTRAESVDETSSNATSIKTWEEAVCCKLSKKVEAECRAVFQTYASQNEDGKVLATQVIQMLQDTGHYLSQKEAALLMHGRTWSASSGDTSSIAENPQMEFMSLLRGVEKEDLTRHIDTAKISRTKQLEFVKLFLSNTAVFADLELSIPGIISAVAERSELLVFHQGECVCAESAPVNSMLIVVDGMITVRKGTTKRTMHASQSPIIFGEDLVFLPVKEVGTFSSSAEIASTHAVVIEVFRHVLQRAVPQEHSKSRQLQNRAIRLKIEQESRYQLPSVRKVLPVIRQQQRAPFGARYRALASVDLFKESVQADPYLISRVAAETELITFDQDEFVFRQGDVGDFLLVVVAGDIKVRIRHENGVSHTHTIHFNESKGGYVLGELAFYTRRHERTADAIVHSETLMALKISRSSLQSIFESSHSIWALIRDRAHKFNHIKEELPSVGVSARLKQIGAQTYRRLINNNSTNINSSAKSPAEMGDNAAPPGSSVSNANNEQSDTGNSSIFRAISAESEKRNRDMQRTSSQSSQGTVSEADFLNIVSMLTFYPLSLKHVAIIRKVFELYATAPLHRHRHIYGKGSLASAEDLYPEGCITLSNLSSMIEDAGLVLHEKVLAHVMDEWKITDATGYLEPAISFTSLLSIIAAAVKRQRLLLEVETIFKIILANDEVMGPKLKKGLQSVESRAVPTDQKWRRLAAKKIGITPEILRGAWLEFLDVDLSPEAAEEMIFEADESENGFVSFGDWLDSIHSVYQIEVEGTDNFTVFETKMMGLDRTISTDLRRDDSVSFSTSFQNAVPISRSEYLKASGSDSFSTPVTCDVKACHMAPETRDKALGFIADAVAQGKVEKDVATQIKRNMDAQDAAGTWHCIVGQDFGASLCFENKHLLFVKADEKHILLFRSFDQL